MKAKKKYNTKFDRAKVEILAEYGIDIDSKPESFEYIETEFPELNALKIFPRGYGVELYGPPGGAKSTVSSYLVKAEQKRNNLCGWVDVENRYNIDYNTKLGVDVQKLVIVPGTNKKANQIVPMETLMDIICRMILSGNFSLIVVDSIPAFTPHKLLNDTVEHNDFEKERVAEIARILGAKLKVLLGGAKANNVTLILINQIRAVIEKFGFIKEATPCGKTIGFLASNKIRVVGAGQIKKLGGVVGNHIKIEPQKTSSGTCRTSCLLDLIFGVGLKPSKERGFALTDDQMRAIFDE